MRNLVAVCHNCHVQHGLTLEQVLHTNSVRDWERKHRGHTIEFLDAATYGVSISRHAVGEYRHNADVKLSYAADVDYSIAAVSALASSSTLLAGAESGSIANTSNLYLDYMVSGHVTSGSSPTAGFIQVGIVGPEDDTPTWPDVFDGTASAETITSANIKNSIVRVAAHMGVGTTTNRVYPFGPVSIAQLFGMLPTHHVLFVTHDTVAALKTEAGTDHVFTGTGVYATVTS